MRFADPKWLEIGAVAALVIAVVLARGEVLKRRAIERLARAGHGATFAGVPSPWRRWARVTTAALAVLLAFAALARPQRGLRTERIERRGSDVLLVVDTSRSMDADDVKPTRLERAKLAIRDLVERLPEDRIGLVAFAGDAVVQAPMTLDHDALLANVDALDTQLVARGGTNIARALDVAEAALASEPEHDKAIVLLSDGEQLQGDALARARKAADAGIVVDTVGIGGTTGELVPRKDDSGRAVGIVEDGAGKPVRSKLDERTLRAVADATHGTYRPLGDDGRGLERLHAEALAPRARAHASEQVRRVYEERYPWALGAALVALLAHAALGLPRRSSRRARGRMTANVAAAAACLFVLSAPALAHASTGDAQRAFREGRFDAAYDLYRDESKKHPDEPALAFGAGDAAYRAGRFEDARAAFADALRLAPPKMQRDVLYNEGNALYRLGESKVAGDRAQAIEEWRQAVKAYEGALALDAKDEDARHNLDLVRRRLAELEKKQDEDRRNEPPPDRQPKNDGSAAQQPQQQSGQGSKGDPQQQSGQGSKGDPQQGSGQGSKGDPQQQSGQGPKADPQQGSGQGSKGDPQQGSGQGSKGDPQQQSGQGPKGDPQQGNGQDPNDRSQQGRAQPQDGRRGADPQRGAKASEDQADGAELSPEEARALLRTLKGDERTGRAHGLRGDATAEDPPQQDW